MNHDAFDDLLDEIPEGELIITVQHKDAGVYDTKECCCIFESSECRRSATPKMGRYRKLTEFNVSVFSTQEWFDRFHACAKSIFGDEPWVEVKTSPAPPTPTHVALKPEFIDQHAELTRKHLNQQLLASSFVQMFGALHEELKTKTEGEVEPRFPDGKVIDWKSALRLSPPTFPVEWFEWIPTLSADTKPFHVTVRCITGNALCDFLIKRVTA